MQVHKHHCKMLAFMKDTRFTAFLAVKAPDDTLEILAILMQKIIFKMLSSGMWSHPGFRGPLTQLGEAMSEGIEQTWAMRRVFPREFSILCLDKGGLYEETQKIRVGDLWSDWSTLHLVWGRLIEYRRVAQLNSLKEPRESGGSAKRVVDWSSGGDGCLSCSCGRVDQGFLWRQVSFLQGASEDHLWWHSSSEVLLLPFKCVCRSSGRRGRGFLQDYSHRCSPASHGSHVQMW